MVDIESVESWKQWMIDEKDNQYQACLEEIITVEWIIPAFLFTHVICFLSCMYREVFSARTDLSGQIMRIMEVLCIPIYIASILMAHEQIAMILIRESTSNPDSRVLGVESPDKKDVREPHYKSDILFGKCLKSKYVQM